MPRWGWDASLRRYRDLDTGRILPFSTVTNLVNDIVDQTQDQIADVLVDMLADGRLNVADWEQAMADAIKDAHIAQAVLSAGGREQMTPRYWGAVGAQVRRQYGYLKKFADQIEEGELTPGQIRRRAQMYINSSRGSFWRIQDFQAIDQGFTEEKWYAVGDKNTCSPCMEADLSGWQPIGTFGVPGSGTVMLDPETSCAGLTNCRCTKDYR